jgi:hypothetical protein
VPLVGTLNAIFSAKETLRQLDIIKDAGCLPENPLSPSWKAKAMLGFSDHLHDWRSP